MLGWGPRRWAGRARPGGGRRRAARGLLVALALAPGAALAGTFELDWANENWPAGATGFLRYPLTDARGFQLSVFFNVTTVANSGGFVNNWPNDTTIFGTRASLGFAYQPLQGNSGIGESTVTANMYVAAQLDDDPAFELVGANGIEFRIPDIDSVDSDSTDTENTDRCDHVTVTGNGGDPTLSYLLGEANPDRSFVIGPGPGTGNSPPLAANQAQCLYDFGLGSAPNSQADDNGTLLASFPDNTSVATVRYDESIENVYGDTSRAAANRGIGAFATIAITFDDDGALGLEKVADRAVYSAEGETVTYTYTVTNNGRLPINTGQDIVIEDDVLGTVQCPAITADILPGGTHACTAVHAVTAGEMAAGAVTNRATAGVGLPGQAFAARLRSNEDTVTIERARPAASIDKFRFGAPGNPAATGPDQTIDYRIRVRNTGNVPLTAPALTDMLPDGSNGTVTRLNGDPADPDNTGDIDGDDALDVNEVWLYTASYETTQADIDAGAPLVNEAAFAAAELAAPVIDTQSTNVAADPRIAISKGVLGNPSGVPAGRRLAYTYDVTNTGNQTLRNVAVADVHNGRGARPVPGFESILFDNAPTGDSSDAGVDGTWDRLGPGDVIRFTAAYTVVQRDIDELQ